MKLFFLTVRGTKIEIDKITGQNSKGLTYCIEQRRNKVDLGCTQQHQI
jgi:hypothetical protein